MFLNVQLFCDQHKNDNIHSRFGAGPAGFQHFFNKVVKMVYNTNAKSMLLLDTAGKVFRAVDTD